MAIYHLNIRHCSRDKWQSAQAKFDYINRIDKYSKKLEDLQYSQNGNLPSFAQNNPELFWQSADKFERANARICTEIEFALPRELNLEQQAELVSSFIKKTIDNEKRKLPFSFAIHNDKANNNPHCHLVFSVRQLDGIERSAEQFFKRANSKNAELGGAKKDRDVIQKDFLKDVRKMWSEQANLSLEKYGYAARIDERSYQEQGIEKEPRSRLDRVTWQELKRLESNADFFREVIERKRQQIADEKAEIARNASKNVLEPFSQKGDTKYKQTQKFAENRKESVSQAEFDMFIYKTIRNAERPKFEHERKIEEWEKSLKQLKSSYASYKSDLERLESEKWGVLGLYQSKEQKVEIERIKGIMGDLSAQFDREKGYIAKEQEKIDKISEQNKPLYERKAQIMRDNPNLIEKSMSQLHQEQFKRNAEKWEQEQKNKQKDRALSRDNGLSL